MASYQQVFFSLTQVPSPCRPVAIVLSVVLIVVVVFIVVVVIFVVVVAVIVVVDLVLVPKCFLIKFGWNFSKHAKAITFDFLLETMSFGPQSEEAV